MKTSAVYENISVHCRDNHMKHEGSLRVVGDIQSWQGEYGVLLAVEDVLRYSGEAKSPH